MQLFDNSWLPAILSACATTLAAQGNVTFNDLSPRTLTAISSPQLGRSFSARLTGLIVKDVVVVHPTSTPNVKQAQYYVAPSLHQGQFPVATSTNTIVTFTDAAPAVGHGADAAADGLAYVDANGLHIWSLNSSGTPVITTAHGAGSSWAGATLVATHPNNGNVIYGIASNGTTLLRTTYGGTWTSTTVATVASPVLALGCCNVNTDGSIDAVVMTANNLIAYGTSSTPIRQEPILQAGGNFGATAGQIVTSRNFFGGTEVAACLATKPGSSIVRVMSSSVNYTLSPAAVYTGLSADDFTLNGIDDIVLTKQDQATALSYFDVSSSPAPISMMLQIQSSSGDTLTGHFSSAMIIDRDSDGDGDLVMLGTRNGTQRLYSVESPMYLCIEEPTLQVNGITGTSDQYLRISDVPEKPALATHLQLIAWFSDSATLQPMAVANTLVAALPGQPDKTAIDFFPDQDGTYWVVVRWVSFDDRDTLVTGSFINHNYGVSVSNAGGGIRIGGITPKSPAPPTPPFQPPALPPITVQ